MRTRRAIYPVIDRMSDHRSGFEPYLEDLPVAKRPRLISEKDNSTTKSWYQDKFYSNGLSSGTSNAFDSLHDDLLLSIFALLSSKADSVKDLINTRLVCKRFQRVASSKVVFASASVVALKATPAQWIHGAGSFVEKCAEAGNAEACYTLGMIRFYCLMDRKGGLAMLGRAAACSHSGALHALGVIQFNGSGGNRADKNLKAGVRLSARAAALGHVDAMRELGHCLQDGYGVAKNVADGRRLILEANLREAIGAAAKCETKTQEQGVPNVSARRLLLQCSHGSQLLSDFGCNVPPPELHIAHEFLLSWFHTWLPLPSELRMCSHPKCGRPETRKHEFRRCSACASVNYCSRACQALHWKMQHKSACCAILNNNNNAHPLQPQHPTRVNLAHFLPQESLPRDPELTQQLDQILNLLNVHHRPIHHRRSV